MIRSWRPGWDAGKGNVKMSTSHISELGADEEPDPTPRDAVICIGGMLSAEGTSLSDVAQRLAVAFDNAAPSRMVFTAKPEGVRSHREQRYRVTTLLRLDGKDKREFMDIYAFEYRGSLSATQGAASPSRQLLSIVLTLITNVGGLLGALRARSQSRVLKVQVFYGAGLFGLVALYGAVLAVTLFATVMQTAGRIPAFGALEPTLAGMNGWLSAAQTSIIGITFVGLFTSFNIKELLAKTAPTLASAMAYLSVGEQRTRLNGELLRLLDYLGEQQEVKYRKIHIVAVSFGSIVALDTLFPKETAPSHKFEQIDTLVTIGCPFDFIRTYWPHYFEARHALDGTPRRWINVFAEYDVFGSNFENRNDKTQHVEESGIMVQCADGTSKLRGPKQPDNVRFGQAPMGKPGFWQWVQFVGFRSHSTYWDRSAPNAVSCFQPIVDALYGSDEIVRDSAVKPEATAASA